MILLRNASTLQVTAVIYNLGLYNFLYIIFYFYSESIFHILILTFLYYQFIFDIQIQTVSRLTQNFDLKCLKYTKK